MRARSRLKEWIAYRRDRRRTRREYRDVRQSQVDHAESERFRGPGAPMGGGHGGGGIGRRLER
jgi:hypothetical protein